MSKEVTFKVGDLMRLLESTTNEFKPKVGKGVEKEKTENTKALKDIMDGIKKYNPEKKEKKDYDYTSLHIGNKTPMNGNFDEKPSENYIKRNEALVKGYSSVDNMNNKIEKDLSLEYEGNERIYDEMADAAEENSKKAAKMRHAGLKTRVERTEKECEDNTMFENRNMKRLHFKKTVFLSEEDMLRHVPEEYKVDGNRFGVKDAAGNEFIVECKGDEKFDFVKTEVVSSFNSEKINEQLERMRQLGGYKSGKYAKSVVGSECGEVHKGLDIIRNL